MALKVAIWGDNCPHLSNTACLSPLFDVIKWHALLCKTTNSGKLACLSCKTKYEDAPSKNFFQH